MKVKSRTKNQKIRRNIEQWQEIMSAYEKSGLTQEAFCHRESVAPSTFYNWHKRLSVAIPTKPKEPMFIELPAPDFSSKADHWDIELLLGDNVVLRMR